MEPPITRMHHGGTVHGTQSVVSRIVIHDEEYPLDNTSAESIANYFAQPDHGPSCAHYVVDSDSEQHCVSDNQIAYHAPPNTGSIGIERDGYASWKLADWEQPNAQLTTCRQAARAAELAVRHGVPVRWMSVADILAGHSGITSHANVSRAFGQSTHTDPGPYFPVGAFMDLVKQAHYALKNDASVKAFQKSQGITVDGVAGPVTMDHLTRALYDVQRSPVAPKPAPAPNPEPKPGVPIPHPQLEYNGEMRPETCEALQKALNWHLAGVDLPLTGKLDKATKEALQHYLKVPVDGDIGPRTVSAMQIRCNHGTTHDIKVNGVWGPSTTDALKRALNEGRF